MYPTLVTPMELRWDGKNCQIHQKACYKEIVRGKEKKGHGNHQPNKDDDDDDNSNNKKQHYVNDN
jgi:hypothetical protein